MKNNNKQDLLWIYQQVAAWDKASKKWQTITQPRKEPDSMVSKREKKELKYASAKKRVEEHEKGYQPTSWSPPPGISQFRFKKAGLYRIDILPYRVGEGNRFADPGMIHYERTFSVHRQIGADNQDFACLRANFKEACPICEYRAKLAKDPESDEDLVRSLAPKERQLFALKDLTEPDAGIQIFETAHYMSFGELLDVKIGASDEEDGFENFFHLEDGLTLKVSVKQDSFQGRSYMKPVNIDAVPRKKPYDESLLDEVPCLDELIKKMDYDELKAIFLQTGGSNGKKEDEEDESPKAKKKPAADEDEDSDEDEEPTPKKKGSKGEPTAAEFDLEEGDVVTYKGKEWDILKVSGDGTSLTLEDTKGDLKKGISPADVKLVPTKNKPGKQEETDEDEEEEEPTPKAKGGKVKNKAGGKPLVEKDSDEDEDDSDEMDSDLEDESDEDGSDLDEDEDDD